MMLRHLKLHHFADRCLSMSLMLRGKNMCGIRLKDAVYRVYSEGNKTLLTPDVGGTSHLSTFTDAVIKGL